MMIICDTNSNDGDSERARNFGVRYVDKYDARLNLFLSIPSSLDRLQQYAVHSKCSSFDTSALERG